LDFQEIQDFAGPKDSSRTDSGECLPLPVKKERQGFKAAITTTYAGNYLAAKMPCCGYRRPDSPQVPEALTLFEGRIVHEHRFY